MRSGFLISSAVAAVVLAGMALPASAQPQPERHLVYDFSVGVQNDAHASDAALEQTSGGSYNFSPSGDTDYGSLASDNGTIDVDVLGLEPDGGLVVKVSEQAQRTNRTAAAVTCVVYPTTNTVCGAGAVNPEEMAVIRTLSPKFFDPSALDAKHHWHEGSDAAGISLDFTAGTPSGNIVPISLDDNEKIGGAQVSTIHGTDTYSYDMAKSVTTQLKEYDTIRKESGPGQYTNTVIDITATLATDGVAAKN
ncbi:MAG TPA: hypothetical protein VMD07_08160 [Candidatus Acidoferrales bacterium]|nr:hypothetical protein [Candidatus Acidoferrales bacterium]